MTHRKSHSILSLLLALVMLFSAVSTTALAADASIDEHIHTNACDHEEITIDTVAVNVDESSDESEPAAEAADPYSGTIADSDVSWTFDPSTGRLFITGSGDCLTFQSAGDQPWATVRTQITEVWFNDMDTLSISNLAYWFDGCTALTTAEIPYTTSVIGTRAFASCPSLRTVLIYHENESLTICPGAFYVSGLTPLEVWYVPSSDSTALVVTAYDWSGDNRAAWFEDVYGISLLASGYCSNCKGTYSYTVAYEPWTSTEHCIRHWCSNCGLDQCGGANGGSHTYNNSGTCTKCGYYNSAYDNSVCYHTSTYTTWSGCNWYKYCSSCGTLVSSGISHGTYVYGAWAYYSTTQHRRTATCSDCGQVSYSYGSHSTSTKYAQDSSTQHTVGSYCSTCGSYIGSLSYESHNFTYGAWTNYSATQHRRTATCSDCGYSTTETESHSFAYGTWTSVSGTEHSRSKICSCGFSSTETASHIDADGDGTCDDCGYLMSHFSVTVPASLIITVSEDGTVYTASDAEIINNSTSAVQVTGITVSAEGVWNIVPYDTNMADAKVNARQIGFRLNNAATQSVGTNELLSLSGNWQIAKDASLPIVYDAVISATSSPISEQVLTIVFVLDWAA